MKTKIIEMYRPSQYDNWEQARRSGGTYQATVAEDMSLVYIANIINATTDCMSAADRVVWRVKPVELTGLQKAFIAAYRNNVGVATSEQVEEFVRDPSNSYLHSMSESEYCKVLEAYDMFIAGYHTEKQ